MTQETPIRLPCLLDRLVDRIIEVKDGEVRSFDGGYSHYIEVTTAEKLPPPPPEAVVVPQKAPAKVRR